jgi:dienelactone hydrolase
VKIPAKLETQLEGFSLRPLLESEKPQPWHDDRRLFQHVARWTSGLAAKHKYSMAGVRQGHYLLLRSRPCDDPTCRDGQCPALRGVEQGSRRSNYTADNAQFHWGVSPADQWALFDTKQDPGCQKDLASTQPDRVKLMAAAYDHWWDKTYPVMIERGGDANTAERKSRQPDRSANKEETEIVKPETRPAKTETGLATQREAVLALGKLTKAPVLTDASGKAAEGDLKPVYFDALPWKGQPTKVFAWLGIPKNRSGKLPGVVLVHGGGGTAFKEWVKKWNERGFAAISIAVEGQTDERAPKGDGATETGWKRHEWAGPQRSGIYGDSSEFLADQWMYHAVADTVLANSLLRSLPEVDPDKVGLMGVSWGGVIASTVVGIDNRFAFAIPVYGCGHLFDAANQYGRSLGNNDLYKRVWDPLVRLANAKMPVLWFSWPQDQHFPMDCLAANCRAAGGPQMVALIPGLGHGHGPPWNRPESYAFAEAIVKTGRPWCRQTESVAKDGRVRVTFASTKPLDKAMLVSTTDTGFSGKRNWVESPAKLARIGGGWQVVAQLPAKATASFVNVHCGDLTASSDYQQIE